MSKTHKDTNAGAGLMWGGRFEGGPAAVMAKINASINFDKRLYAQDIAGSRAHCTMLVAQGILTSGDGDAILAGLDTILREIEAGAFAYDDRLEDIHTHVEVRLRELIGDAAGRLHTARSRNDQVATDLKLWVRERLDALDGALADLQRALLGQAERHGATAMPGFTHLQAAQPVTLGHHLLAYVEMFARDRSRARDARARLNVCPLGAAALAGTSFPIDREMTARALGFARPTANSIDAVSDRDFALEFLSGAAITAVHLSRLAEELVIWSSAQFRFVTMPEAFATGSSIMPQKKNPDAAELVRAKVGRIVGALNTLIVVMKGLPLAYSKDMQEDKEAVFDAADSLALSIAAMTGMIADLVANPAVLAAAAGADFTTATDLADWLVRRLDMPFREAHQVTGRLVRLAEARDCGLEDLALAEMQAVAPGITGEIYDVLGVENSIASRTSFGGTAPARVAEQIASWKERLR